VFFPSRAVGEKKIICHGFARMGTDKDREMGIFLWLDFYIRVHP
jgi:hypothetical protein